MKSPTSLFLIFFNKNVFLIIWVEIDQKIRDGFWGQVGFKPVYLQTHCSYLNSEKCILILIKNPLIWYIMGLCGSKFDPVFKGLKEGEVLSLFGARYF